MLRLLICSFSWARLMERLGSISRFRGASRLLLTDSEESGAPCRWPPLLATPSETPLKPAAGDPKPLERRTELILLLRLRLMMRKVRAADVCTRSGVGLLS